MNRNADPIIGQRIKTLRRRRRLTQAQLADRMFGRGHQTIRQVTITKIENGTRPLWVNELADLADILDTPMVDILQPIMRPLPSSYERIREQIEAA